MPPKTVLCSVCGETVLKAQTLARKDGTRACRNHLGVIEESGTIQKTEKARRDHNIAHPKRKPWEHNPEDYVPVDTAYREKMAAFREQAYSHCWCCGEEGVGLQEFFAQVLVAMKRLEIRGEFNPFNLPADVAHLTGKLRALAMVSYQHSTDRGMLPHIRDHRLRELVPLLGSMLLCITCARRYGYQKRWESLLPNPTFEQVMAFMPVVEAIEPTVREIAERKERQS